MSNDTNTPATVTDETEAKTKPFLKESFSNFKNNYPAIARVSTEAAAGAGYALGFVATVIAVGTLGSLLSNDEEELEEDED